MRGSSLSGLYANVAGQLRLDTSTAGFTKIFGDVNGDSIADFQIDLQGSHLLTATDFVL
jgi:hypothetical protein